MNISKFKHSCFEVEHEGSRILFDPGFFTFMDGDVQPERLAQAEAIIITHDHPDHLHVETLKKILAVKQIEIYGNSEVVTALKKEGLKCNLQEDDIYDTAGFTLEAIPVKHEPIIADSLPLMMAYLINGKVLNVADSLEFTLSKYKGIEVLCMPVIGPFLNEIQMLSFAQLLLPKMVVPLHEAVAKDFFAYSRFEDFKIWMAKDGIDFKPLKGGESVEVN